MGYGQILGLTFHFCIFTAAKVVIISQINNEKLKNSVQNLSFLTFRGDFMCKMALKNVRLQKMAGVLLHIIAI